MFPPALTWTAPPVVRTVKSTSPSASRSISPLAVTSPLRVTSPAVAFAAKPPATSLAPILTIGAVTLELPPTVVVIPAMFAIVPAVTVTLSKAISCWASTAEPASSWMPSWLSITPVTVTSPTAVKIIPSLPSVSVPRFSLLPSIRSPAECASTRPSVTIEPIVISPVVESSRVAANIAMSPMSIALASTSICPCTSAKPMRASPVTLTITSLSAPLMPVPVMMESVSKDAAVISTSFTVSNAVTTTSPVAVIWTSRGRPELMARSELAKLPVTSPPVVVRNTPVPVSVSKLISPVAVASRNASVLIVPNVRPPAVAVNAISLPTAVDASALSSLIEVPLMVMPPPPATPLKIVASPISTAPAAVALIPVPRSEVAVSKPPLVTVSASMAATLPSEVSLPALMKIDSLLTRPPWLIVISPVVRVVPASMVIGPSLTDISPNSIACVASRSIPARAVIEPTGPPIMLPLVALRVTANSPASKMLSLPAAITSKPIFCAVIETSRPAAMMESASASKSPPAVAVRSFPISSELTGAVLLVCVSRISPPALRVVLLPTASCPSPSKSNTISPATSALTLPVTVIGPLSLSIVSDGVPGVAEEPVAITVSELMLMRPAGSADPSAMVIWPPAVEPVTVPPPARAVASIVTLPSVTIPGLPSKLWITGVPPTPPPPLPEGPKVAFPSSPPMPPSPPCPIAASSTSSPVIVPPRAVSVGEPPVPMPPAPPAPVVPPKPISLLPPKPPWPPVPVDWIRNGSVDACCSVSTVPLLAMSSDVPPVASPPAPPSAPTPPRRSSPPDPPAPPTASVSNASCASLTV